MRRLWLLAGLALCGCTSPREYAHPWDDPGVPLVIDAYGENSIDWDRLATEPRVVAVIHKGTIGTTTVDPAYFARRAEARRRGYLWGSYHWGVAGDPEKQADYYLDTVRPAADELIALDLEDASSTKLMNAAEALLFLRRVRERTGRTAVLYTNHSSARLITERYPGSDFSRSPLWYARFRETIPDFPAGLWSSYTLWQFSSEILPQKPLPGVKSDMDVNVYRGTVTELRRCWPLTRAE